MKKALQSKLKDFDRILYYQRLRNVIKKIKKINL